MVALCCLLFEHTQKAADSPGTSGDLSMARGGASSGGGGGGSAHVNNEAMAVKVKARLESAAAEFTAGWRAKGVAKDQQQVCGCTAQCDQWCDLTLTGTWAMAPRGGRLHYCNVMLLYGWMHG